MVDIISMLDVLSASNSYMLILIPGGVIALLALLFIPSMLTSGAKPRAVAKALYCYLMQGIGIILMSIGVLPTLYSVFGGVAYPGNAYLSLLVVFGAGGAFYLWHEQMSHGLDIASRAVPSAIYHVTLMLIGKLLAVFSGLSLALSFLLRSDATQEGWWVEALILLLYGLALEWMSHAGRADAGAFYSVPMNTPATPKPAMQTRPAVKKAPTFFAKKSASFKKKRR